MGRLVVLDRDKSERIVKEARPKLALADLLVRHHPLHLHHEAQHLVIGLAGEENLAGVELKECARNGPNVNGRVVRKPQDDLWRAVEATDQVRRNVALVRKGGRAEIAQLDERLAVVDQDIVGLDIGVKHVTLRKQRKRQKEVLRKDAHGAKVEAHIAAHRANELAKIHVKRLEHKAEVAAMLKGRDKPYQVLLVRRVRVIKLAQYLKLLLARLVHRLIAANHLDRHLATRIVRYIQRLDDRAKHAAPDVRRDAEATVENLADLGL